MKTEDIERILRQGAPDEANYFRVPLPQLRGRRARPRRVPVGRVGALGPLGAMVVIGVLVIAVLSRQGTTVAGPTATTIASPSQSAVGHCTAGDLEITADGEGATGTIAGGVSVANVSGHPCILRGYPGLALLDVNGAVLVSATGRFSSDFASDDTITLEPRTSGAEPQATAQFSWQNWCGQTPGGVTLAVRLPDDDEAMNVHLAFTATPRCDASDQPSTLTVGPFVIR